MNRTTTRKHNIVILWVANFLVAASATMIMPFLSLYIDTFGHFSNAYTQKWAGLVFGITFLVAFFVSPIWGRFGDKFGRKKILIISSFGIASSLFLMGYVQSVLQLFILRMFSGVFTGFIPTSIALISAQTSKREAGRTLGTLQTGTVTGGLLGPLFGGILADTFGFQYTFMITAILIAFAGLLVLIGVNEVKVEREVNEKESYTRKEVFSLIFQNPLMITLMFVTLIVQIANFSIQPLLALYVTELYTAKNVALVSGFAFSATGLGNLLATRKWGSLGDKFGYEKVLFILLLLSAIFYLPQAFVTNIWGLVIFRFLFGLQVGGLIPVTTALIRQISPASIQGEVLGYNVSFRFLGNVIGPIAGGVISGYIGISSVFIISSGLFLVGALMLKFTMFRSNKVMNS
jgi:MFS transporter, DHA1 family, multidrug resistance protein